MKAYVKDSRTATSRVTWFHPKLCNHRGHSRPRDQTVRQKDRGAARLAAKRALAKELLNATKPSPLAANPDSFQLNDNATWLRWFNSRRN